MLFGVHSEDHRIAVADWRRRIAACRHSQSYLQGAGGRVGRRLIRHYLEMRGWEEDAACAAIIPGPGGDAVSGLVGVVCGEPDGAAARWERRRRSRRRHAEPMAYPEGCRITVRQGRRAVTGRRHGEGYEQIVASSVGGRGIGWILYVGGGAEAAASAAIVPPPGGDPVAVAVGEGSRAGGRL